jgi:hypothetical protein
MAWKKPDNCCVTLTISETETHEHPAREVAGKPHTSTFS